MSAPSALQRPCGNFQALGSQLITFGAATPLRDALTWG